MDADTSISSDCRDEESGNEGEAAVPISSTCIDKESDCSIGIEGEHGEIDAGASI